MNNTDIIFIKVKDNKTKLWQLCDRIRTHFLKGEFILVTVPNQEAANYLDDLLWRYPEDSFLPHRVLNRQAKERIAITLGIENVNNATILFNLLPTAFIPFNQFTTLYEFYDETHPTKVELSKQRLATYPHHTLIT